MQALGVTNVNYYARATEHIPEIISQIERLKELGFAYETQTGIYFDESLFPDFGKLSHQSAEDLKKHRIEPDPTKRNSGDFALWKKRQTEDGGSGHAERSGQFDDEIAWDSPWGKGRPGWHIEDTAITETYFGQQYDIHGGAMDLIFPHHEAEIAQMEAIGVLLEAGNGIFKFHELRNQILRGEGPERLLKLKNLRKMVRDQIEYSRRMIMLIEKDPTIGFHFGEGVYRFNIAMLNDRIASLRLMLQKEFPVVEKRLKAGLPALGDD